MSVARPSYAIDIAGASRMLQLSECPTPPMAVGRVMDLPCAIASRVLEGGCEDPKRAQSSAVLSRCSKRRRQFFEEPAQRYAATIEYYSASGLWSELLDITNREVMSSQTDACTYCLRAAALLHTGNPREAISDCNRALMLDDQLQLAYSIRAHCHYDVGDTASASEDFKRLMEAQPTELAPVPPEDQP